MHRFRSILPGVAAFAAALLSTHARAQERARVDVTVRVHAEDGGAPVAGA